jgi:hypothetical protein
MKSKHFIAFLFLNSIVQPVQGFVSEGIIKNKSNMIDGFFLVNAQPENLHPQHPILPSSDSDSDADTDPTSHEDIEAAESYIVPAPTQNDAEIIGNAVQTPPSIADNNRITMDASPQFDSDNNHMEPHEPPQVSHSLFNQRVVYASGAVVIGAASLALIKAIHSQWQRRQINNVLKKYGKTCATISSVQLKLMMAAYNHDSRAIRGWVDRYGDKVSPREKWIIRALCDLYFGKENPQKTVKSI